MESAEEELREVVSVFDVETSDLRFALAELLSILLKSRDNRYLLRSVMEQVDALHSYARTLGLHQIEGRCLDIQADLNEVAAGVGEVGPIITKTLDIENLVADLTYYNKRSRQEDPSRPRTAEFSPDSFYGKVLGLKGKILRDDVRRAYLQRIKEYHPDRVADLGEEIRQLAHAKTQQLNEAYEYFKEKFGL